MLTRRRRSTIARRPRRACARGALRARGAGLVRGARLGSRERSTSSTRAPTRARDPLGPGSCATPRTLRRDRGVRAPLPQPFGFLMPDKPAGRRGVSVEAIGARQARTTIAPAFAPRGGAAGVASRRAASSPAALARCAAVRARRAAPRRPHRRRRRSCRAANATTVVEPGWQATLTAARPPGARARRSPRGATTRSARPPIR